MQTSSLEVLHEVDESDFFELAWAYLVKVNSQNVRHVEVPFHPTTLNRIQVGGLSQSPGFLLFQYIAIVYSIL